MTRGRRRRWCACGCGELLPETATKRRRYLNVAHRQRAARRRGWAPPLRTHEVALRITFTTRAGRLVAVTTAVDESSEREQAK
jgi:hypothetical protein